MTSGNGARIVPPAVPMFVPLVDPRTASLPVSGVLAAGFSGVAAGMRALAVRA